MTIIKTPIITDSFTESESKYLYQHISDSGHSWVNTGSDGTNGFVQKQGALTPWLEAKQFNSRNVISETIIYPNNYQYATFVIKQWVSNISRATVLGVYFRMSDPVVDSFINFKNYVYITITSNFGEFDLIDAYEKIDGTETQIVFGGTFDNLVNITSEDTIEFRIKNNIFSILINGVTQFNGDSEVITLLGTGDRFRFDLNGNNISSNRPRLFSLEAGTIEESVASTSQGASIGNRRKLMEGESLLGLYAIMKDKGI